jgi:hypothetical protein
VFYQAMNCAISVLAGLAQNNHHCASFQDPGRRMKTHKRVTVPTNWSRDASRQAIVPDRFIYGAPTSLLGQLVEYLACSDQVSEFFHDQVAGGGVGVELGVLHLNHRVQR